MDQLRETASPVEIIWTVWCVISLAICSFISWKFLGILIWYYANSMNGIRRSAAWLLASLTGSLTVMLLTFVLAGIIAMLTPPPNVAVPISPGGVAVATAFIISAFIAAINSVVAYVMYHRVTGAPSDENHMVGAERAVPVEDNI